jgi:hypothetical protein
MTRLASSHSDGHSDHEPSRNGVHTNGVHAPTDAPASRTPLQASGRTLDARSVIEIKPDQAAGEFSATTPADSQLTDAKHAEAKRSEVVATTPRIKDTGPTEGVPRFREHFIPLVYRRVSFMYYRASTRFTRHREIVGRANVMPVPLVVDALAMYLCRRLPAFMVARLGPRGLRRVAEFAATTLHVIGIIAKKLLWPVRFALRHLRRLRAWLHRKRHTRALIKRHFVPRSPSFNAGALFESAVALDGHEVSGRTLTLFWRRVRWYPEVCQIFVHLFPENTACLPTDREIHGYFFKDHFPAMDIAHWPRGRAYRDAIDLTDLPEGHYRIVVGLVRVRDVGRVNVDATGADSVDLGWITLNK